MARRLALLAVLVAVGAALVAGPGAAAPRGPIKIGLIVPLTGVFAPNGRDMVNGLQLAFSQVGYRVAGRQIQVLTEDDQGVPAQTLTKARKLVELDKVDLIVGPLTANSGYALRDYIDSRRSRRSTPLCPPTT